MSKRTARLFFLIAALFASLGNGAEAAQEQRYDRKFFIQLRSVFGRFRDSDLERSFDRARAIQCSELVNEDGEWRTVAFFNEKRELGDWYRSNFDEVKTDLSVFIFKGVCRGDHGPVQLTTRFPVTESIDAFNNQRIGLDQVAVNVNAPVRAAYDTQTQTYAFDLPYLFLVNQQGNESIYSLNPPSLLERYKYATDVSDRWDCKSVVADSVTYRFLICRTSTFPRNSSQRNTAYKAFGASAYFILSDGKEASSSVKLTFDDVDNGKHTIEDPGLANLSKDDGHNGNDAIAWEVPDSDEKLLDIMRNEFRLRFSPQSWTGRIGAIHVLSGKRLMSLDAPSPGAGIDYCMWMPATATSASELLNNSGERLNYAVATHDQDTRSPTSIALKLSSAADTSIGTLQCYFPRATSAAGIAFGRWASIVGDHVTLEVRP